MKIRIKYFDKEMPKLELIGGKSDWIDLRAAEDVTLRAGEFRLIPLGVAMQLPEGYEAHVLPRSSTFKNYGMLQANAQGVIDFSYRGPNDMWRWPAYATREVEIKKYDRICQFRIEKKQPEFDFDEVEDFEGEDRGGFGSTGKQ